MGSEPRFLIIIACSKRKRPDSGWMPALDRYDGLSYRILRKAKREARWSPQLDVIILSARYGLLEPEAPIADYDLPMTPERAGELRPAAAAALSHRVRTVHYAEVFVNLGRTYRLALEGWELELGEGTRVLYSEGGIGQQASQMLRWLGSTAGVHL